nr:hypothetical protein KitaXyl93_11320 [Kitasatospora sp. Xyl93]
MSVAATAAARPVDAALGLVGPAPGPVVVALGLVGVMPRKVAARCFASGSPVLRARYTSLTPSRPQGARPDICRNLGGTFAYRQVTAGQCPRNTCGGG